MALEREAAAAATGLSRSATPAQQPSITDSWRALLARLTSTPLHTSPAPTIPSGIPAQFIGYIYNAHNAGLTSARGIPTQFETPLANTSAVAQVLWAFYNQGYQHGLTMPSLIQNTTPITHSAPAPKLHEPEDFDGTRAKFTKFMTKLALVFSSDPARYSSDLAKISYAASYLSGSAADWFEPHLNKATGHISFTTYEAFVRALKSAYDDPDARATAERKLHNLKQGNRDCSAYHAEFATYATVLGYDDRTKISFFSNGANQGLKTALSYQASPPENFDEFVQLCIKLDNRAKLLHSQSSHPRPAAPTLAPPHVPRPLPSTASGSAAGPMDLSQADRTPRKRGPLSAELRKYRQENHLCMYCGGSGHWASVCPLSTKPKRVNAAQTAPPPPPPQDSAPGDKPLYEVAKN